MTVPATFIDAHTLAIIADIGLRCAQKALSKGAEGRPWRGHRLDVRVIHAKGGNAGAHYEVEIGSLPSDLRARIAPSAQPELPLIALSATEKGWRRRLVSMVLEAGDCGSSARASKIRQLARTYTYPAGKRAGQPIAEKTLRSWVMKYERKGDAALTRARRADRGRARVIAWRAWDRAMTAAGVSEERQADAAIQIVKWVKTYWANGIGSVTNLQFTIQPNLRDIAGRFAPSLTRPQLDAICPPPAPFLRRYKRAGLAHKKRTDAGGWSTHMVARIHRDRSTLQPMEMVSADVRHSDIMVARPDGSLATPKLIVFEDLATNRLFMRLHIMKKGEMVRREHVLGALRDLFSDPSWGVPQQLYLDNGSEFRTGPAADELAGIVQFVRETHQIERAEFETKDTAAISGIIRSRPYSPQSKIIEGIFSIFTRSIEPMFPGFIDGNRMAKKVENQGRAKVPMPGDEAAIQATFRVMLDFYNAKPQQRGHIRRRSPNQVMTAFIENGWKSIVCNPTEFALAFGNDQTRKVETGGEFQYDSQVYRHDALLMRVGERIRIRVPILDAGGRIPVLDDKDGVLCVAGLAPTFSMRDLAGAREQGRLTGELNRQVRADVEGLPALDLSKNIARAVAETAPVPIPEQLATVSVHPVLREAAKDPVQSIGKPEEPSPLVRQAAAARRFNEAHRRAS